MKKQVALSIALFVLIAFADCSDAASLPEIKYEKYQLSNGLQVILHEDHALPIATVNIWYHTGSKNEKPGRTGFAHLFEHMMFQGSANRDQVWSFEEVGGSDNATTNEDRTSYYDNIPPNYLEKALWMESDRLGFLLPAMTQKKLDNQRDVVKNERRQRLENEPYNKIYDLLPALLYSKDHPYSWPVIGSMADLSVASLEDVSEFFRSYYSPNNASLCIAGDFDPIQVKAWVQKYFGPLPPGPPVDQMKMWVPKLDTVRRAVLQDNVNLPKLFSVWHSPAQYAPGDAELDLLANILTGGKTSRLYKSLVYDQQIAQDVSAYQDSHELGSNFVIEITTREGHTLEEIEKAMESELQKIFDGGVTSAELKRAQNGYEAGFVRSLERVGGFGGRADALNRYNMYLGNPGSFQWDLDRYTKATTTGVQRYAKETLDLKHRVVVHIVPIGELAASQEPVDRKAEPKAGPEPAFTPPAIQRGKLSNGLEVFLVEDHKLPLVHFNLVLRSGWAEDPKDRPGAASITSAMLDEGTTKRTALQISDEAQSLGASLGTGSTFDGSSVSLNVLKKNLDAGLDLLSDIVLHPTFPPAELERQRKIYLGQIAQEAKEPETAAFNAFFQELYGPDHPYGQPYTGSGTEASVRAIQRDDLQRYYQANYYPNNAAVVIAGDLTMEEAKTKLEKIFAGWKPGEVKRQQVPQPPAIPKTTILILDKPGAVQSIVIMGNAGVQRSDPDYETLDVMNNAFGGQFTSRLNLNLREEKGYTYGAGTFFLATRGPGPWIAYAPVQVQNTKESLSEMVKEIHDVLTTRPLTDAETANSKNNLIKSYPRAFQTVSGIAAQMGEIFLYELPLQEWTEYLKKVEETTPQSALKAAQNHIHPDAMLIVVVGDRPKIEAGIRELKLGEIGSITVN